MPTHPYDYATVRLVPRVERGEFINVGVIVYAPTADHLACRMHLDRQRLHALAPHAAPDPIDLHLRAMAAVCQGDTDRGPVGRMPLRERFHWLVHPRSAMLQGSAVHGGLSGDLDQTLQHLFATLVAP